MRIRSRSGRATPQALLLSQAVGALLAGSRAVDAAASSTRPAQLPTAQHAVNRM